MNEPLSRVIDLRTVDGSVVAVRQAAAELLSEAARLITLADIEVPGAIVFTVKREYFDIRVTATFKPFDPTRNLE